MGGYAEILIAFAMVALLGLILRFTFGRELPRGAGGARFAQRDDRFLQRDDRFSQRDDDGTFDLDENAYMVISEHPTPPAAPTSGDDFGLLAPVALTADEEQAKQLKLRLGEAHIRATTTRGRDGRYRVLVFATELDRARRVTGGTS